MQTPAAAPPSTRPQPAQGPSSASSHGLDPLRRANQREHCIQLAIEHFKNATRPALDRPFASVEDAFDRLTAFHVLDCPEPKHSADSARDGGVCTVGAATIDHMQHLEARFLDWARRDAAADAPLETKILAQRLAVSAAVADLEATRIRRAQMLRAEQLLCSIHGIRNELSVNVNRDYLSSGLPVPGPAAPSQSQLPPGAAFPGPAPSQLPGPAQAQRSLPSPQLVQLSQLQQKLHELVSLQANMAASDAGSGLSLSGGASPQMLQPMISNLRAQIAQLQGTLGPTQ